MAKKKKADGPKGKSKDKSAKGKSEKGKASKLPKRIAGVKVPKPLRESGGKLLDAVTQPLVMDIVAAALIAAAAKIRGEAGRNAGGKPKAGAPRPKAQDVGAIIAATAAEGLRRIADSALASAKAAGGGNGRAPGGKDGASS